MVWDTDLSRSLGLKIPLAKWGLVELSCWDKVSVCQTNYSADLEEHCTDMVSGRSEHLGAETSQRITSAQSAPIESIANC